MPRLGRSRPAKPYVFIRPPLTGITGSGGLTLNMGMSGTNAQSFPSNVLGLRIELLLNGTWTDITRYVYQRSVISITRGRPNETQSIQAANMTMVLNNRDSRFTPKNSGGAYYPYILRNTQVRVHVFAQSGNGTFYSGYRFWGEVASWPPQSDTTGNDVTVTISAAGIMQRLTQNSRKMGSATYRYVTRLSGTSAPQGYWPCEDNTSATQFASAIPSGNAMTWTGTPSLSSNTSFGGSDAIAALNGSVWTGVGNGFSDPGAAIFSTPGSGTWLCPTGVTSLNAECWAGGSGAGAGSNVGGTDTGGSGGGGGEFAQEPSLHVTPGNSYNYTVGAGGSGAASGAGNAGNQGGNSTFGPDDSAVTVTAHASGVQFFNGGTGSANTTHHDGGSTGSNSPGVASPGAVGAPGGGGSGGTAAAGNNGATYSGTSGGAGGTAVTNGGAGGSGGNSNQAGMQGATPGGGGGGGGYDGSNSNGGGNGAAGEVALTWTPAGGGTTPLANVLRFFLSIPAGGGVNGAVYGRMLTTGTIARVDVVYGTGGTLQIIGYNNINVAQFTSSAAGAYNGVPVIVSVELTPNGSSINWALKTIPPGISSAVTTVASGTQASASIGALNDAVMNPGGTETGAVGIGHVILQGFVTSLTDLAAAASGYNGERAGTRFLRLLSEENIGSMLTGNASDTPQMGPQPDDTLVNCLQQVEDLDRGQLYETTGQFGLGYRTRVNMQNQSAVFTLDYSLAQLSPTFAPTYDDQLTRNSVTLTRGNGGSITGSSVLAEDDSGSMSVNQPPNGVGFYAYQLTVNAFADSQLASEAGWILTLGTIDDFRYPQVTVDLTRVATQSLFAAVPGANIGDFFQIANPPAWMPTGTIKQLAYGFQEQLNNFVWTIAVNAVPESPYTGAGLPTW